MLDKWQCKPCKVHKVIYTCMYLIEFFSTTILFDLSVLLQKSDSLHYKKEKRFKDA